MHFLLWLAEAWLILTGVVIAIAGMVEGFNLKWDPFWQLHDRCLPCYIIGIVVILALLKLLWLIASSLS